MFREAKKERLHPGDVLLCKKSDELATPEILPYNDRFAHMLLLGPDAEAKRDGVLLPLLFQDFQTDSGVTILTPSTVFAKKVASLAEHCRRKAEVLEPQNLQFNPLVGKERDVVENFSNFARLLVDGSTKNTSECEEVFRNGVRVLKRLDQAEGVEGKYATLNNLRNLLRNTDGFGKRLVDEFINKFEDSDNRQLADWFYNTYFRGHISTDSLLDALDEIVLNKELGRILNPEYGEGVNFYKHFAQSTILCISLEHCSGKLLAIFLMSTLESVMMRHSKKPGVVRGHILYLDEFQAFSQPEFARSLLKSSLMRIAMVLSVSALSCLSGRSAEDDALTRVAASEMQNVVLFPGLPDEDAEYYESVFRHYAPQSRFGRKKPVPPLNVKEVLRNENGQIVYSILKNGRAQPAQVGTVRRLAPELALHIARDARDAR